MKELFQVRYLATRCEFTTFEGADTFARDRSLEMRGLIIVDRLGADGVFRPVGTYRQGVWEGNES